MKPDILSIVLFLSAIILSFTVSPKNEEQQLAEKLLGQVVRIPIESPDAYQSGDNAILFFRYKGFQGQVHGALVVKKDHLEEVVILKGREGVNNDIFQSKGLLEDFRHHPVYTPIVVDAVSGATVTCQKLIDIVNQRLHQWKEYDNNSQ